MNGFREGTGKLNCVVCDKEIMAGKRCIECFMSKKKKKPERPEVVLTGFDNGCTTDKYEYTYLTDTSHTITATDTTDASGRKIRTYKAGYPEMGLWGTQDRS